MFGLSVSLQLSSMEVATLCAVVAVLRIVPNRSQFFRYDSLTLSCADHETSSDWRIKRNTSTNKNEECALSWGKINESHCFIGDAYPLDSGVYWCESGAGECSRVVNITVADGSVILDSPVLPAAEGGDVILRCITKEIASTSKLTEFYKDGQLVGNSSTGIIILHDVIKSDEGLYKCRIIGAGESAESWLSVRDAEAFRPSFAHVLLPAVVCACVLFVFVMLLCRRRNHQAEVDHDVSYTDVTFPQQEELKEDTGTDAEPTLYSTVTPRTNHKE